MVRRRRRRAAWSAMGRSGRARRRRVRGGCAERDGRVCVTSGGRNANVADSADRRPFLSSDREKGRVSASVAGEVALVAVDHGQGWRPPPTLPSPPSDACVGRRCTAARAPFTSAPVSPCRPTVPKEMRQRSEPPIGLVLFIRRRKRDEHRSPPTTATSTALTHRWTNAHLTNGPS
jgi:hypothetical protein